MKNALVSLEREGEREREIKQQQGRERAHKRRREGERVNARSFDILVSRCSNNKNNARCLIYSGKLIKKIVAYAVFL